MLRKACVNKCQFLENKVHLLVKIYTLRVLKNQRLSACGDAQAGPKDVFAMLKSLKSTLEGLMKIVAIPEYW